MRFHNVDLKFRPDRTGREVVVPALVDSDGNPMMPLLRYQQHLHGKVSQGVLTKVREAVRLFAEYSIANPPPSGFGEGVVGPTHEVRYWEHFRNFRDAIRIGTFGPNGDDPSGLCWLGSGSGKANSVIRRLTEFFRFLDELDGGSRVDRYNPNVTPTAYEALCAASAYEYRRAQAFLGHTWERAGERDIDHRAVAGRSEKPALKDVKRIDDHAFHRLLQHGFDVQKASGLRDALICILMNKTGVRVSEALHAWVTDIIEDPVNPGFAHIRLRHPAVAKVNMTHGGKTYRYRVDYLHSVYGLPNRIDLPTNDPMHLGWKTRLDVLELYWAEPWWSRVFWSLYLRYLHLTAHKRGNHPYVFIDTATGGPLTYEAFRSSHARAIYRAGLVPKGSWSLKNSGLTPHAHRHAYGHRLKNQYGCDTKVVQKAMHHISPESQVIYTAPSVSETRSAIEVGAQNIKDSHRRLEEMKKGLGDLKEQLKSGVGSPDENSIPQSIRAAIGTDGSASSL